MFARTIYVSTSKILPADAAVELDEIVQRARSRNKALSVTGALIYTGELFAQCLEGPYTSVNSLMADICIDPRHDIKLVTEPVPVAARVFENWSLAYKGSSTYVQAHLLRCLASTEPDRERRLSELVRLMCEFVNHQLKIE